MEIRGPAPFAGQLASRNADDNVKFGRWCRAPGGTDDHAAKFRNR
jgi:hypothetical protein